MGREFLFVTTGEVLIPRWSVEGLQKTVQGSLRTLALSSLCMHLCVPGVCGQNAPRTPIPALREYRDFAMGHDGNALRGQELFSSEQRTACVKCHSADGTSGKETYGAGRFIHVPFATDGKTVIDFNKAYNPPCAFNNFATCPLPPFQNRLALKVSAGEKKYAAASH